MWFQQDRAGCHRAQEVTEWFEDNNIDLFPHPPCSPDISPIKPCWADMKRDIASQSPRPVKKEDLIAAIKKAWENLPIEKVNSYIRSIPRRLEAVRVAEGGITRY